MCYVNRHKPYFVSCKVSSDNLKYGITTLILKKDRDQFTLAKYVKSCYRKTKKMMQTFIKVFKKQYIYDLFLEIYIFTTPIKLADTRDG